ncbi:MAG: hypothetical protein ACI83W_002221 [Marinoscillum sp.]|jgi:hypothetical protein
MRPILSKPMLGFLFMVLLGLYSVAQEKNEQVKVIIIKDVDGESKTFEKSSDSEDDMRADKELDEFMGEDHSFWFSSSEEGRRSIELMRDEMGKKSFFFELDEEGNGPNNFRFLADSGAFKFSGLDDLEDRLPELMEQLEGPKGMAFNFSDEDVEEIVKRFQQRAEEGDAFSKRIEVIVIKKVKISEDVEEFGKKGQVKTNEKLILEDLSYYPNSTADGNFRLKFKTPTDGELAVKIYNIDGKEVFNRYFEKFSGLYSERIDLTQQKEGIYLLEITQEGKRLTRKIIVD